MDILNISRITEEFRKSLKCIKGVFFFIFSTYKEKYKVIDEGLVMFDRKPIVGKAWTQDIDVSMKMVNIVPILIRLPRLSIKNWGKSTLTGIAGLIGKLLKADSRRYTKRE